MDAANGTNLTWALLLENFGNRILYLLIQLYTVVRGHNDYGLYKIGLTVSPYR